MSFKPGRAVRALASLAALAVIVGVTYAVAERMAFRALREATSHRMAIYAANLQAEMKRFEYLPEVISLDQRVLQLLGTPVDELSVDVVNGYLQTVNDRAGASAIYLMDRAGTTLAASNWNQPGSFVNMRFAYRPYFLDAAKGGAARFYGIGVVSHEAGYYFSHAVMRDNQVLGVAAVKVSLEKLDASWEHDGEKIIVADGNGVIFLSSEPDWKYRTLNNLSSRTVVQLEATRQYMDAGRLSPLGLSDQRLLDDGTAIVQIKAEAVDTQPPRVTTYMVHGNEIPGTDWRLLMMSELSPVRAVARTSAAVSALISVLLATLVLYFQQRRKIALQAATARIALQRANDELELQVERRTEALSDANVRLQDEIGERRRAEETLRATLNDLVHTAKMAVLGQMSAGITHELNQPLTALRTLSSNTIIFLKRAQPEKVEANLQMIAHLTDHMGKITAQLKKFARKSTIDLRPVLVTSVVDDTLFLMSQGMRSSEVDIERRIAPEEAMAMCDANRLEQVLLNLLSNAADAVTGQEEPRIVLTLDCDVDWVTIGVHDNGPGISSEVAARLFEPFFSTKAQGLGLGLGLAISADIVREFGGTLNASASELLGGAMFAVRLKAAIRSGVVHA